jgi:hypothetical protein
MEDIDEQHRVEGVVREREADSVEQLGWEPGVGACQSVDRRPLHIRAIGQNPHGQQPVAGTHVKYGGIARQEFTQVPGKYNDAATMNLRFMQATEKRHHSVVAVLAAIGPSTRRDACAKSLFQRSTIFRITVCMTDSRATWSRNTAAIGRDQ